MQMSIRGILLNYFFFNLSGKDCFFFFQGKGGGGEGGGIRKCYPYLGHQVFFLVTSTVDCVIQSYTMSQAFSQKLKHLHPGGVPTPHPQTFKRFGTVIFHACYQKVESGHPQLTMIHYLQSNLFVCLLH